MQYIRTFQDAERNAALKMRSMGFVDADVTTYGADGGIDVRADGALAQVKWSGAAVTRDELQKLFGARGCSFTQQLLFFAASAYSKPAVEYANRHGIAIFVYEPHGGLIARNLVAASLISIPRDESAVRQPPRYSSGWRSGVQSADVYKAGNLVGSLERIDGEIEFRYAERYLDPIRDRVAWTLPVGSKLGGVRAGAVPAFFAGLLPEGERLAELSRSLRTAVKDDLSLLLAVGADTPGDVQILPADADPVAAPALADEETIGELEFKLLAARVDRHALPGVQCKASAERSVATRNGCGSRSLLKLPQASYPNLIENESAHLAAARMLKIPVAASALVRDASGIQGLLVSRFDRISLGGVWHRLAFEDATQVLGLEPSAKYDVDAVAVVEALAGVVGAPMVAVRNLYLQFLFAWLTGNSDLHGKNLGVLRDCDGRWGVAPMYDIPCTLIYGDDSMALPICGRVEGLRARHWSEFAVEIGLSAKAAASAQRVALRAAGSVDVECLPFAGSPKNRTIRELKARRAELERSFETR